MPLQTFNLLAQQHCKIFLGFCTLFFVSNANAEPYADFINETSIDGKLRAYYFSRNYASSKLATQQAFSFGGQINLLTAPLLPGLQAGTSLYFAQSLGLNSKNPKHVDNTLPGYNIVSLGQAYLQYQDKYILFRAGNQLIDTPWLNPADSRMIPMTYQGFYSEFKPIKELKLTGLRVFHFKDKTDDCFSKANLYNPDGISRSGIAGYGNTQTNGALAFGAQYKLTEITTQTWYYHYYDLANLLYLDVKYESNKNTEIKPILGAQFLREWGDGKNLLKPYTGGAANATGYGILARAKTDNTQLTVGYNFIPTNKNAFRQGNILTPYTAGNDPLYTTAMISGLAEKAPGHAIKMTGTYYTLNKQLQFSTSYAQYYTAPRLPNTNELDFDVSYALTGTLKGLTIRYRLGVLNGNKATGQFTYHRLMLQYNF